MNELNKHKARITGDRLRDQLRNLYGELTDVEENLINEAENCLQKRLNANDVQQK
tara:strand:+ start:135 stop:299 length:165 start_codon:yes stop_codon:yes gene_type:complete